MRISGQDIIRQTDCSNGNSQDQPSIAAAMLKRLQTFRRLKIDGIPNLLEGKTGFEAPKDWKIR